MSLNATQSHIDPDGRLRVVVAHSDPASPNWLDTAGKSEGMIVYRWVLADTFPVPEATVVPLADHRSSLPEVHPTVSPAERAEALRRRRRAATERYS